MDLTDLLTGALAGQIGKKAGVAVIAALGCVGFQLYTWQEVKMHLLCAAVFILIPNIGMWIITGTKLLQCGLRSFIFE